MNKFLLCMCLGGLLLLAGAEARAGNVFDTVQQGLTTAQDASNMFGGTSGGSGGESKLQSTASKIIQWGCWVAYIILTIAIIVQLIKMGLGHQGAINGLVMSFLGIVIAAAINWLVPWLISLSQ